MAPGWDGTPYQREGHQLRRQAFILIDGNILHAVKGLEWCEVCTFRSGKAELDTAQLHRTFNIEDAVFYRKLCSGQALRHHT